MSRQARSSKGSKGKTVKKAASHGRGPRVQREHEENWHTIEQMKRDHPEALHAERVQRQEDAIGKCLRMAIKHHRRLFGHVIDSLGEMFDVADADGSGALTQAELGAALHEWGAWLKPSEVDDMMHIIDADGDGIIERAEFVEAFKRRHRHFKAHHDGSTGDHVATKNWSADVLERTATDDAQAARYHAMSNAQAANRRKKGEMDGVRQDASALLSELTSNWQQVQYM